MTVPTGLLTRRSLLAAGSTLFVPAFFKAGARADDVLTNMPRVTAVPHTIPALSQSISRIAASIADPALTRLFETCLPNTLETAVVPSMRNGKPDTFILTGDIPAMWLRDAACQMRPYLPFTKQDATLRKLFAGLFNRFAACIAIDPYANAFWHDPSETRRLTWAVHDETEMKPGVAERKWEVDSLCFPMWLAAAYWDETADPTPFAAEWWHSMALAIETMNTQRRLHDQGPYHFRRLALQPSESQFGEGWGMPGRAVGLIHSAFRPSDDSCVFPFNIPANLFAARALEDLARLAEGMRVQATLAERARALSRDVRAACIRSGLIRTDSAHPYWAYEVDGFGNSLFMDDANLPSLLGLPLLGAVAQDDPVYQRTRERAWSANNPWFFSGPYGTGIGGPHEGQDMIWPMSLIVLAMTSSQDAEILSCLAELRDTRAGVNVLHESFNSHDPTHFTRPWFAWVNGLFGQLILQLDQQRPHLLKQIPARSFPQPLMPLTSTENAR